MHSNPDDFKLSDTLEVRVKFSEIDSMRCVWHGSYVKYLEDGRENFGRRYPGIGYDVMLREQVYAPMYDLQMKYLAPLSLNDIAVITTTYHYHPGARLDFSYEVRRKGDQRLCLTATSTQLFINAQGEQLLLRPPFYEEWLKKYKAKNRGQ